MSSWFLLTPTYENFNGSSKTWDRLIFSFILYLDAPDTSMYYDLKAFFHRTGYSSSPVYANWNLYQNAGQSGTYSGSLTFYNIPTNVSYAYQFQICYSSTPQTYNPKENWWVSQTIIDLDYTDSTQPWAIKRTIVTDPPPVYTWAWVPGTAGSWNQIMHGSDSNYVNAWSESNNAIKQSGHPTTGFKRVIWNDMIDWMIYTYNKATHSSVTQSYFQNISGKNSYIDITGDPKIFTADMWNGMRTIANYTARALGGSSFLNTPVARGDPIAAHIFSDVTRDLNGLINSYKYD